MNEEVLFARLPSPAIQGQSPAGDDDMEVGMVHEILAPGVQYDDS